ncbi:MAG: hypothetical protein ACJA1G_002332 [Qipengyuania sp.]|jgi:hypothetical protein
MTQYEAMEQASVMRPQSLALSAASRGAVAASVTVPRQGVARGVLDAR